MSKSKIIYQHKRVKGCNLLIIQIQKRTNSVESYVDIHWLQLFIIIIYLNYILPIHLERERAHEYIERQSINANIQSGDILIHA